MNQTFVGLLNDYDISNATCVLLTLTKTELDI
jgi:hypothetical protein